MRVIHRAQALKDTSDVLHPDFQSQVWQESRHRNSKLVYQWPHRKDEVPQKLCFKNLICCRPSETLVLRVLTRRIRTASSITIWHHVMFHCRRFVSSVSHPVKQSISQNLLPADSSACHESVLCFRFTVYWYFSQFCCRNSKTKVYFPQRNWLIHAFQIPLI